MYFKCGLFVSILLSVHLVSSGKNDDEVSKSEFPDDFLFGVASSAYQIEGGHNAEGKGPSIWDYYTRRNPKKFRNGSNGNVACDSFHLYKEDVKLLKNLGVHFYRFSIAWSRILPDGYSGNVNRDGLRYYNDLINELISNGIQPMVTMYHYDLPMPLMEIGGLTNPYLAYYFEDYARILFSYFGDRVKHWVTFNGGCAGYGEDSFAPFLNQSGIANYMCLNVVLLAHSKVYHMYDNEFRMLQKGKVGITLDTNWYQPASSSEEDVAAAERVREFQIGIKANPIFHPEGNYPEVVRERVDNASKEEGYLRSRLPVLTPPEVEFVQGTYDFLGLNFYTTFLVEDAKLEASGVPSVQRDMGARFYSGGDWPQAQSSWLRVTPFGIRKVLTWLRDKYDDPDIYITENGFSDKGELNDFNRIKYYQEYLRSVLEAIHEDKVSVKAYFAWSLMDNFEWMMGYSEKFGLHHVDFTDPKRKRTPKKSAHWFKRVIKEKRIVEMEEISSRMKGDL